MESMRHGFEAHVDKGADCGETCQEARSNALRYSARAWEKKRRRGGMRGQEIQVVGDSYIDIKDNNMLGKQITVGQLIE
jgi:hypothetical protein